MEAVDSCSLFFTWGRMNILCSRSGMVNPLPHERGSVNVLVTSLPSAGRSPFEEIHHAS